MAKNVKTKDYVFFSLLFTLLVLLLTVRIQAYISQTSYQKEQYLDPTEYPLQIIKETITIIADTKIDFFILLPTDKIFNMVIIAIIIFNPVLNFSLWLTAIQAPEKMVLFPGCFMVF